MYPPKEVSVWVVMSSKGIINPYGLENTQSNLFTENSEEDVKALKKSFKHNCQQFPGYNSPTNAAI